MSILIFHIFFISLTQVQVPEAMEAFINLSAGRLIYEGPRSMVQFVIQSTKMILKDPKYLVAEITLKRMCTYHLAATFLPTALLMIVTQLTLFVDEKHFEATIMVHLTTMLVMYTLYQGVSAGMPKTADLKFIDIWLLFGLIVPFVTFIVETSLKLLSVDDDDELFNTTVGSFSPIQSQMRITPISRNKETLDDPRKSVSFRKKTKSTLYLAAQILIPLVTVIFTGFYSFLALTYYSE